jgi:hypothetical protein
MNGQVINTAGKGFVLIANPNESPETNGKYHAGFLQAFMKQTMQIMIKNSAGTWDMYDEQINR